jgi:hypothetical protein
MQASLWPEIVVFGGKQSIQTDGIDKGAALIHQS